MMKYKVTIKCTDMTKSKYLFFIDYNIQILFLFQIFKQELLLDAVHLSVQAFYNAYEQFQNYNSEFFIAVAEEIKHEFDKQYKPTWHVIVGSNFGSFVTHENKNFVFLEVEGISILIFKSA